jgi:hypothetical protein
MRAWFNWFGKTTRSSTHFYRIPAAVQGQALKLLHCFQLLSSHSSEESSKALRLPKQEKRKSPKYRVGQIRRYTVHNRTFVHCSAINTVYIPYILTYKVAYSSVRCLLKYAGDLLLTISHYVYLPFNPSKEKQSTVHTPRD